jgi:outer membrane murein-binding lipoprotein Lpp
MIAAVDFTSSPIQIGSLILGLGGICAIVVTVGKVVQMLRGPVSELDIKQIQWQIKDMESKHLELKVEVTSMRTSFSEAMAAKSEKMEAAVIGLKQSIDKFMERGGRR